ncbi:NAD-dependent epimerase/dehydratase family protein [Pedobacter psychrodurus]|uniref:NAD-dependent epimerase/dehydratase family protein n=1 Tax=Pedobacter psychrodurus TaxID=2530456 RepID=A0A4R0PZH4_9SPHI|nr:NAD(P)H-binding protein [Pedobacter psychrodurus]TCD28660.1 NAD-dependent epimerase/dehydratase family protein [Pedobacter psychrodurus]
MNIVLTGSLGNIGKPLTELLIAKGHQVKVISSKTERIPAIEALGAVPLIGTIQDADFLASAFSGSDAVYLMEAWEAIGSVFDKNIDFLAEFGMIASNYVAAIKRSGVTNVIHLSSIGAHSDKGMGSLLVHHNVEQILQTLPENVNIKFVRPVGFFSNIYRWLPMIHSQGAIIQSWGGDNKEPWVSPYDIAEMIAGEMEKPFTGRTVQYVASDEVSPNEIAWALANSTDRTGLQWKVIPADELFNKMISSGINPWIAKGMVEMQQAQQDGSLYEDFYQNKPQLGKIKLEDFAKEFAEVYNKKQ